MPRWSACSVTSSPSAITSLRSATSGARTITTWVGSSDEARATSRLPSSRTAWAVLPAATPAPAVMPTATTAPTAASRMDLDVLLGVVMCPPERATAGRPPTAPDNTRPPTMSRVRNQLPGSAVGSFRALMRGNGVS